MIYIYIYIYIDIYIYIYAIRYEDISAPTAMGHRRRRRAAWGRPQGLGVGAPERQWATAAKGSVAVQGAWGAAWNWGVEREYM